MEVKNCGDKEKLVPEGAGIVVDGVAVRRQRSMIYWYRWGRHTFDVRVIRKLLSLPEDHAADKWFMEQSSYFGRGEQALKDIVAQIDKARGNRKFRTILVEHDRAHEPPNVPMSRTQQRATKHD